MEKKVVNENPLVSIVIINYNTAEITIQALKSIDDNTSYYPYEVLIIDNASEQEDQSILKNFAQSKSIPIQIMHTNIGMNSGVNYGFSLAKGELLVSINSDVMVEKGWLKKMVDLYKSYDNVAAINANIYEDGKSIVSAKNDRLKILHGACSMYSSESWDLVGEWDDKNFKFYGTENDWSYRARSFGYLLLLSEGSRVNHLGSSKITVGGLTAQKTGKRIENLKIRLDGRVKARVYNFKIRDWLNLSFLYEFKEALKNGYLIILVLSYIRVLLNIKNIYLVRKERYLKLKHGVKILDSNNGN
tara:strand:- start:780 stop:1685 length:906 start_codon:yes stop_codon:yes gene_type:complete